MSDSLQSTTDLVFTSTNIIAALIGIVGTILVALLTSWLTYHFTRKARLEAEWRIDKLKHYQELMSGLTYVLDNLDYDVELAKGIVKYLHAANMVALVAPQKVITLLSDVNIILDKVIKDDSKETRKKAIELFRKLVLELRNDLKITPKDDPKTFDFHFLIAYEKSKSEKSKS